jgi:DNA-binding NtrC family response regulator
MLRIFFDPQAPPRVGLTMTVQAAGEVSHSDAVKASFRNRVLIVVDDLNLRQTLSGLLNEEGYVTDIATDGEHALERLKPFDPDVVLVDLKLSGTDALSFVTEGKTRAPHATFLVITSFGALESAVQAIRHGAESYLIKPLDLESVSALVVRARERASLSREIHELRARVSQGSTSLTAEHAPMVLPPVTMAELERMAIIQTLANVSGSTAKAAELLGISRRKIQYRLKEWGQRSDIPSEERATS